MLKTRTVSPYFSPNIAIAPVGGADTNRQINQLRTEQIDVESRQARLQNELTEIDAEERKNDIRRERLAAELSESTRSSVGSS